MCAQHLHSLPPARCCLTQVEGLDVRPHFEVVDDHGGQRGRGAEQRAVGHCSAVSGRGAWQLACRQQLAARSAMRSCHCGDPSVQQHITAYAALSIALAGTRDGRLPPPLLPPPSLQHAPSTSIWRGCSPVLRSRSSTALNMTSSASWRAQFMSNSGGSRCRPAAGQRCASAAAKCNCRRLRAARNRAAQSAGCCAGCHTE